MNGVYEREMNYSEVPYLLYRCGEKKYVFDSSYGNLFEIDNLVYELLRYSKVMPKEEIFKKLENNNSKQAIIDAYSQLEKSDRTVLNRTKLLYDLLEHKKNYCETPKVLCLNVSQACNLKCKYCFIEDANQREAVKIMSKDVAKKAIDFWASNTKSKDSNQLIGFFGGEPLLNIEVITWAVEYIKDTIKKKNCQVDFTITTNGTLMNRSIDEFLINNNFDVNVSLDGHSWIQNKNRPFRTDDGKSYEIVKKNIQEYINMGGAVTCLMTILPEDIPFLASSVMDLWEIGVKRVSATLAFGENITYTYADYKEFDTQIEILTEKMYDNIISEKPYVMQNIIDMMRAIHFKEYKVNCYLWHNSMATFSTTGEAYSCQRFTGDKQYSLGDLNSGIDFSKSTKPKPIISKCERCPYQLYCGDGCAYENIIYKNDIAHPADEYCAQVDIIFNASIRLYLKILNYDSTIISKILKDKENSLRGM